MLTIRLNWRSLQCAITAVVGSLSFIAKPQHPVAREGPRPVQRSSAWSRGNGFSASSLSFINCKDANNWKFLFEIHGQKTFYAHAAASTISPAPRGGQGVDHSRHFVGVYAT